MTKARDLADGVINTSELADGSITTAKIADSSISAAKIVDGDITDAKLATGISASKLTGALPAVDGSALTGVGGGLKIAAVSEFNNSGTWTPTANTNYVEIAAIGAGGGSGAYYYLYHAGGGGGGVVRLGANRDTFGASETVTIGSGGSLGQYTGAAGGTTSFGNYFTLNGGNGGTANTSNNGNATGGTGGTASTNLTAGGNVSYILTGTGGNAPDLGPSITGNTSAPAPNQGNLANEGVYSTAGRALLGYNKRAITNASEALVPNRPATPDKKVNLFSADYIERRGGSGYGYVKYNATPNTSSIFFQHEDYGDAAGTGDRGYVKITEYEDL